MIFLDFTVKCFCIIGLFSFISGYTVIFNSEYIWNVNLHILEFTVFFTWILL